MFNELTWKKTKEADGVVVDGMRFDLTGTTEDQQREDLGKYYYGRIVTKVKGKFKKGDDGWKAEIVNLAKEPINVASFLRGDNGALLAEKDRVLAEHKQMLTERDAKIAALEAMLAGKAVG